MSLVSLGLHQFSIYIYQRFPENLICFSFIGPVLPNEANRRRQIVKICRVGLAVEKIFFCLFASVPFTSIYFSKIAIVFKWPS